MQSNSDEMKIRIITAPVEMMSRFGYYKSLVFVKKPLALNILLWYLFKNVHGSSYFFLGRKTTYKAAFQYLQK